MYVTETLLTEQYSIVEKQCLKSFQGISNLLIAPDNYAELLIPLKSNIQLNILGISRSYELEANTGYFLTPRRRGITLGCNDNNSFILLKLNPIYSRTLSERLEELFMGIYRFDLSIDVKDDLLESVHEKNIYFSSDILMTFMGYEEAFSHNETILNSINLIKSASGRISVREIYENLEVSKSKLEQHFNKEIGLTPKEFCRIEKLNFFIDTYWSDPAQSLTELTYQCGYYDQSHLIKDFRYFLEMSPKKYFEMMIKMY